MSKHITIGDNGELIEEEINGDFMEMHSTSPLNKDVAFTEGDKVNNPSHYQSYNKDGIDCITAMQYAFGKTAVAHFCLCNTFKYLWRHSSKNGMEDINKALWYLNKYKELNIIELGD